MSMAISTIKKTTIFLCLLLCMLSTTIFHVSGQETTYRVVCTNSVLADFSSNILPDNISIEYILPAGACPAHFDTSPSDVSLIANADIIVSLGWEPWLDGLITSSGNTDATQIRCSGIGEWNLPEHAIQYVETLRDNYAAALPEFNRIITQNAQAYLSDINTTATDTHQLVTSNGLLQREIICIEWYHEFLSWLGLNVTYTYGPPEGLSTQDLLNISAIATQKNVNAIIDNLQSGTEFGARVASESGATHIIFTNFPMAVPGADTYLEMMEYNTNQLINGITTYDYRQGELSELTTQVTALELERNTAILLAGMFAILTIAFAVLYKRK